MSIQTELTRISDGVSDALVALEEKGVTIPDGIKVDGLADLIAAIEAGGGGVKMATLTFIPAENITLSNSASTPLLITHNSGFVPRGYVIQSMASPSGYDYPFNTYYAFDFWKMDIGNSRQYRSVSYCLVINGKNTESTRYYRSGFARLDFNNTNNWNDETVPIAPHTSYSLNLIAGCKYGVILYGYEDGVLL